MGLWQSKFYDHIVRDESEYLHIWQYIDENSANWQEDRYFLLEIEEFQR